MPSGRALLDYKNFNHTDSVWHMENIQNMKKQFDKMKPPNHAKLGELVFDKVKIKRLVFDHKNWELVSFTDLCDEMNLQHMSSNFFSEVFFSSLITCVPFF